MNRLVLESKLESLRRCIARIETRLPDSPATLSADADAQDIITLNLTRAVQLCVDVGAHLTSAANAAAPRTMGETFDQLAAQGVISATLAQQMKAAVGFRNIAIHNYQAIDWRIVHRISQERLTDFSEFARAIAKAAGLT